MAVVGAQPQFGPSTVAQQPVGVRGRDNAILAGVLYGLLLYGVMYCVVLAARYPALFPQTDPVKIAISLFPHIFFVGIPLALMMRRAQLS